MLTDGEKIHAVTTQFVLYRIFKLSGLVLLILGGLGLAGQPAAPVLAQTPTGVKPVRVIVTLREPAVQMMARTQSNTFAAFNTQDIQPIHLYETLPGMAAEVTPQGLETLRQQPEVEAVALDLPVEVAVTGNVSLIGADRVWRDLGFTGAGVNVAVLDTGIDTDHPDLAGRLLVQKCFTKGSCPPDNTDTGDSAEDGNGHGTHIAGIIAGQGQIAPTGIAPGAGLVAVRVMGSNGSGYTSDVIAAIDWIVAHQDELKVKVINLSLGGGAYSGTCDDADANTQLYAKAVQAANQAGITVFAASGNQGLTEAMMAPACVSGVVAVGATYHANLGQVTLGACTDANTVTDQVACISNSGPTLDLLAPGIQIDSTAPGGGQRRESGTSMSTAHASAVAALMLQAKPDLTPTEVETILKETGVTVTDDRNGRVTPRIDAWAAVSQVAGHTDGTAVGVVLLQGRTNYSGTQVRLSAGSCADATSSAVTTTTGPDGHFELTVQLLAGSQPCLQVTHPGYLAGQHNAASGNLGVITLPGGDVTGDNAVDIFDLAYIASRYNGTDPSADLNADGLVDIFDLTMAAGNYNRDGPVVEWK